MASFKDARTAGRRFANQLINFSNKKDVYQAVPQGEQEPIENVVFEAMHANPYKSGKSRQDFIDGASEAVNQNARLQISQMNNGC